MTASLTDFLAARLDDDVRIAKFAAQPDPCWEQEDADRYPGSITDGSRAQVVYDEGAPSAEQAAHIARHDPSRVLRGVAAHRAILAEHEITDRTPEGWAGVGYGCTICHEDDGCIAPRGYCTTLRALAAIWSDHPAYSQDWAPEEVTA